MAINGLRKFSLIDYPGQLACVAFCGGCNFRCPFCHNPALVFDPESQGDISAGEFSDFLESRRLKLDGVVFSGGEPTLQNDLPLLSGIASGLGFKVKLDTNGSRPEVIAALHASGHLDALGIDYKAPMARYAEVCGSPAPEIPDAVRKSIAFAVRENIELDVRTTVHKALLDSGDLESMWRELRGLGVKSWTLQQFHIAELLDERLNYTPTYSGAELTALAFRLGPEVKTRGII